MPVPGTSGNLRDAPRHELPNGYKVQKRELSLDNNTKNVQHALIMKMKVLLALFTGVQWRFLIKAH